MVTGRWLAIHGPICDLSVLWDHAVVVTVEPVGTQEARMGLKSKVWTIAVVLSALMLVPSSGVAQATSLRATPSQYDASARLYGVRDYQKHSRSVERRERSNVTKGAMIGAGVGATATLLLLLMMHDSMDSGGSAISIEAPGIMVIGGAIGAFFGAAIGAGFD